MGRTFEALASFISMCSADDLDGEKREAPLRQHEIQRGQRPIPSANSRADAI